MGDNKPGNIKVCVRVRPENDAERSGAHWPAVCVIDQSVLVFDPPQEQIERFYHGKAMNRSCDPTARKARDQKFAFDRVFASNTTNIDVYEHTTKGVLRSLLDGYNCSVFAYGATGAGKTFTMLGSPQTPGVIFLTMMDLYNIKDSERDERTVEVGVSYLEVYNEEVKDLLSPAEKKLPVREDAKSGVIIQGLSVHEPQSAEELLKMLESGNKNRTQHPTDANAESSRSHAVFQVFVKSTSRTADITENSKQAKLSLIDLAGSERATVTKNKGARLREGANINRSLLALGNCINALADTKRKGVKHIPYRNSKLTRILKDSLGGNCKTVMIAAVSPSRATYEDTYNTLKYADRAKHIKAMVKKNTFSMDLHVQKYAKVVEDLHSEITQLKERLRQESEKPSHALAVSATENIAFVDFSEFHSLYAERIRIRDDLLHIESMQKQAHFKVLRKERVLARLDILSGEYRAGERTTGRIERAIGAAHNRDNTLERTKTDELESLTANSTALQEKHKAVINDGTVHEQAHRMLRCQTQLEHQQLEISDLHKQNKHLEQIIQTQETDSINNERLVHLMIDFITRQHEALRQYGLANQPLSEAFKQIKDTITNDRHVSFFGSDHTQELTRDSDIHSMMQLPVLTAKQHESQATGIMEPETPANATFITGDNVETTFDIPTTPKISYAEAVSSPVPVNKPSTPVYNKSPDDRQKVTSKNEVTSPHQPISAITPESLPSQSPVSTSPEKPPTGISTAAASSNLNPHKPADDNAPVSPVPSFSESVMALKKSLDKYTKTIQQIEDESATADYDLDEATPAKQRKLALTVSPGHQETSNTCNLASNADFDSDEGEVDSHAQSAYPLAIRLPSTPDVPLETMPIVDSTFVISDNACDEGCMEMSISGVQEEKPLTPVQQASENIAQVPVYPTPAQHTVLPLISRTIEPTMNCATPPSQRIIGLSFADVVKSPALQSFDENSKSGTVTKSKPGYLDMTASANHKRLNFTSEHGKENS